MTVWRLVNDEPRPEDLETPSRQRGARLRIGLAIFAALLILIAIAVVPASGIFSPNVSTENGTVQNAAGAAGPRIGLVIANDSWTTVTLTSVRLATSGLSGGSWFVANHPRGASVRIPAHRAVELNLDYAGFDCAALARAKATPVVINIRSVLGFTSSLRVMPLRYRAATGRASLSWTVGSTWGACHPGTRLPALLP